MGGLLCKGPRAGPKLRRWLPCIKHDKSGGVDYMMAVGNDNERGRDPAGTVSVGNKGPDAGSRRTYGARGAGPSEVGV